MKSTDIQTKLKEALSYLHSSGHDGLAYRGLRSALRAQNWTLLGRGVSLGDVEQLTYQANQYASSLLVKVSLYSVAFDL